MWEQVFTFTQSQIFKPFLINYDFSGSYLIIRSSCAFAKSHWVKVGYCSPLFTIPNIGIVEGESEFIKFGNQRVHFDNPQNQSFKLNFYMESYLPTIDLVFYIYTGELDDVNAQLAEMEINLSRVESKIDNYFTP